MHIHPARDHIRTGKHAELAAAPRLVVELGKAPDDLPWLLRVDRSRELAMLFQVVPQVFGLAKREDLPPGVRNALERDVAAGLMGVHEIPIEGRDARAFVSRKKLKHLLGPTLLSQLLEPRIQPEATFERANATNAGAMASRAQDEEILDAVDRTIEALRAKRHLLLDLEAEQAYSCGVRDSDRALRTPSTPIRPLAFESLSAFGDVNVSIQSAAGEWTMPLADVPAYHAALTRVHHESHGGWLRFEISRQHVLAQLVRIARDIDSLHRRERVHADVAPGNVLVCADGTHAFDGLDLAAGTPATAATFEWAAPEQIVGHPVDPRTDVYALGRMASALLGGVVFGEQTEYVVPIGGGRSRQVKLLKAEGVFLDVTDTSYDRSWQQAWQEVLGRAVSFDRARRHATAGVFADALADVLERYPATTRITLEPAFGDVVPLEWQGQLAFAHLADD